MTDFFGEPSPSDESYCTLKTSEEPHNVEAREFVRALWNKTEPYLDRQVRVRAASHFQQAFWEMYLCAALLEVGLPVTPRELRRCRNKGPDLQIGNVEAWCEAIAVTAGTGADAVGELEVGRVRPVPHDAIKLRLTGALREKKGKFEQYTSNGLVSKGEPCIVAINAALVPSARMELDIPRIVTSVFPFGWPAVRIDKATGASVDSYYTHQSEVAKSRGAPVPTDTFLTEDYAGVSAVLYSTGDSLNRRPYTGSDFVLVHNPNSSAPVPRGLIARGREYWKEGDQLHWADHND